MKAKIQNGKIKSIGNDNSMPYELPTEIGFDNFRFYVCMNLENTSDINSWKIIEPDQSPEIVETENTFSGEPETEEVSMPEAKPEINVLKIFSYVTLIAFMVLLVPSFIQTLKEKDWVSAVVLIVFGAIGSTLLSTIYKDVKSWIKK